MLDKSFITFISIYWMLQKLQPWGSLDTFINGCVLRYAVTFLDHEDLLAQ